MIRRFLLASITALSLALLVALPAAAGGWASASLQKGAPTDDGGSSVGITLLQHGVTPVDWGEVGITAVNASSGERLTFSGTPRLSDGRWTTWIELPPGSWNLAVTHTDLQVGSEEGLSLTVGAPAATTSAGATAAQASPVLMLIAGLMLVLVTGAGAGFLVLRRRMRVAAPATHEAVAGG